MRGFRCQALLTRLPQKLDHRGTIAKLWRMANSTLHFADLLRHMYIPC